MALIHRAWNYARRRALPGPYFASRDVAIGRRVRFGRNVVFESKRVRIGDGVIFHDDVRVEAESFEIGDYGTVLHGCFFPGGGAITIGHNFWLGNGAVVDSKGGTRIGNNVGVGAHSQLWTHIGFGDTLQGCRFTSQRELIIEDDAWLVGHCLVSPVRVGARSLALLGSLVTRDMEPDHTYAGAPAKDVTDKVGPQFAPRPIAERAADLADRIERFRRAHPGPEQAEIVTTSGEMSPPRPGVTCFNVADRTYRKRGSNWEHALMWTLLPAAKFTPL